MDPRLLQMQEKKQVCFDHYELHGHAFAWLNDMATIFFLTIVTFMGMH